MISSYESEIEMLKEKLSSYQSAPPPLSPITSKRHTDRSRKKTGRKSLSPLSPSYMNASQSKQQQQRQYDEDVDDDFQGEENIHQTTIVSKTMTHTYIKEQFQEFHQRLEKHENVDGRGEIDLENRNEVMTTNSSSLVVDL